MTVMQTSPPGEVTQLLDAWVRGDEEAFHRLVPLVYDEIRQLAGHHLRRERSDHTLQPTALAHEAFLRLVDQRRVRWHGRAHFLSIAAGMIRRILVDHARGRGRGKRGGGAAFLPLSEAVAASTEKLPDLVALEDSLVELTRIDPPAARVVELRFFAGLTDREIAAVAGVSPRTVSRRWRTARAWLYRELAGGSDG